MASTPYMPDLLRDPANPLSPEAHAALLSAIGSVSGIGRDVDEEAVSVEHDPGKGSLRLRVRLIGWSPSLHLCRLSAEAVVAETEASRPSIVLAAFHELISGQRELAATGVALGTAVPLEIENERPEIRHLRYDRDHLAITNRDGWGVQYVIRDRLQDLYEDGPYHDGGHLLVGTHAWSGFREGICIAGNLHRLGDETQDDERAPSFDGRIARIPGHAIPETLISALPGRRIGEIAAIDDILHGRTIVKGWNAMEDGIPILHLQVEPMPVAAT